MLGDEEKTIGLEQQPPGPPAAARDQKKIFLFFFRFLLFSLPMSKLKKSKALGISDTFIERLNSRTDKFGHFGY